MKVIYNIPDKLWYVKPKDEKSLLAYMTYLDFTKSNELSSACKKRIETGCNWARNNIDTGVTFGNVPTSNIYISHSVSRWTTQNKLFRIVDPRGFEIELSTGNIALLLHYTTVVNGYITEPCVYCYEGGEKFLLPINSELYEEITQSINEHNSMKSNLVKMSDLQVGKLYEFLNGEIKEYLGRYDIEYTCTLNNDVKVWETQERSKTLVDNQVHLFRELYVNGVGQLSQSDYIKSYQTAKIGKLHQSEYEPSGISFIEEWLTNIDKHYWQLPARVTKEFASMNYDRYPYRKHKYSARFIN